MAESSFDFSSSLKDSMSLSLRVDHKCFIHLSMKDKEYYQVKIDPEVSDSRNLKLVTITRLENGVGKKNQCISFFGDDAKPLNIIDVSLEKIISLKDLTA